MQNIASSALKLFKVSRPISWVNTAFPFAATYLVLGGGFDALFFIGTLFFLIPYNLLMYGINDVFDYESDIRNPRKNSIEGAMEAKQFHPTILWASAIFAAPFTVALVLLSPIIAAAILALVIFFVVAYSLKGLRFKEIAFLDSFTSSMHFVGPMIFAIALTGFNAQAWPFALALFLWGFASHAFGAVQDVIPDRKGKLQSVATIIGAQTTVRVSFWLYVLAATVTAYQGGFAVIAGIAGLIYAVNLLPFMTITDKDSARANRGWKRFIWLNYGVGFVVAMCLILSQP